jgi:peptide/nickel transport system permease protein
MTQLMIRKLALTLPTLLVISIVAFSLTLIIPGDAATAIAGEFAEPEVLDQIRENLGLDRPVPLRFVGWLGDAVRGDFGESFRYNLPVSSVVSDRIAPTLWLAGGAFLFTVLLSLTAGILAAARRGGRVDRAISTMATGGLASPYPQAWMPDVVRPAANRPGMRSPSRSRTSPSTVVLSPPSVNTPKPPDIDSRS